MLTFQSEIVLAPFTTFGIGGPAEYFVQVATLPGLIEALEYAEKNQLPVFVFSGGSNLLIADRGIRGVVIRLDNKSARVHDQKVLADAGADLLTIVQLASEHGLAGIERLAGIPGSLGGAIRGNAGAFGMEIGQVIQRVKFYDRDEERIKEFSQSECQFAYRTSYFKTHPACIVLSAELLLKSGIKHELQTINAETIATREAKHPQTARCAGSFFMNPRVKDQSLHAEFFRDTGVVSKDGKLPAGWLIDHVGLRGKKIGGAQVSPRHPNYLINTGAATAENVIMLASIIKQKVRTELGIRLREEIQYVGF